MTDHDGDEIQPREHRAGAWVLLVVGVAALGLGLYQWRFSVLNAFSTPTSDFKTESELEEEKVNELRTKDTDGDGITDFDESYVFKTSPYLDDSDSDGITDKAELEAGTNPNCPEGKDCGPLAGDDETLTLQPPTSDPGEFDDTGAEVVEALLNPTIEQIRQLLLDSGVSEEELEKIDDETLLLLYQESLAEAQRQNPL